MNTEIKNASIQQINIAYHAVEDRLLLKIGYADDAELAVWLTRRLVKGLWQLLQADEIVPHVMTLVDPAVIAPEPHDVEKDSDDLHKLDFTSEYKSRQVILKDEILLAKDCHILKSANQQASLELVCANGQTIKLLLTQDLAIALTNMLQLVSKETAWELPLSTHTPVMSAIQTSSALH
ncbi:MAG: hypothetical protein Q8J65_02275 [Nitrosomonadales bacterium]|nr:hypothetical protein [Nitrosomonadales bacterium]